jgi:hypothetical protein
VALELMAASCAQAQSVTRHPWRYRHHIRGWKRQHHPVPAHRLGDQ